MDDGEALKVAVDLLHVPSRVRTVRADPLPRGVSLLLRIAAGDNEAVRKAMQTTDRPAAVVRDAAGFFIEQVLLCPEADSYRVLGASPEATSSELRRNMALLFKWLHPDSHPKGQQSIFVNRVTIAWDELKTPERRTAYDRARRAQDQKGSNRPHDGHSHGGPRKAAFCLQGDTRSRDGLLHRALLLLLGGRR